MYRKHRAPTGSLPGTIVPRKDASSTKVHVLDYTASEVNEFETIDLDVLRELRAAKSVTWITVEGLKDVELIRKLGEVFDLHPLALEDVVHFPQRPKCEEYEGTLFLILSMLTLDKEHRVHSEEIRLFLGPNFVLSFQEGDGEVLAPVQDRIRRGKGIIRKSGSDYLAYTIIDAVIDSYFPVLESLGDYLEEIETKVVESPTESTLTEIYQVRRELLSLRRTLWPQREVLSSLITGESKFFGKAVRLHLRDCSDHCVQMIDMNETYRELCASLTDVYLSGVSNRMNEIMKVLTIISTIFIPLSFLAGVYGMNFENMPELHLWWAYPLLLSIMFLIICGMLYYFCRKGWISLGGSQKDK